MRTILTKEQIDYLLSKDFEQNDSLNSGYYFIEDERITKVLIPQIDNTFKLEFYELCDDGDGNFYTDYDKEYSSDGQSLEEFINYWI